MINTILQLLDEYKSMKSVSGNVNIDDFLNYIRETINKSNMLKFYFD